MPLNFPLSTAADYIDGRILRHACALRPGWTSSIELQQSVLAEWQALVDEENALPDMAPAIPQYTLPITTAGYLGNNRDYQIGPGAADFAIARPTKILKCSLLVTTTGVNSRIHVDILPWEQYADISVLQVPATGITTQLYIEETFPIAVLHFWPPINANSILLWTSGVLVAPALTSTVVAGTFPPGYENHIVYQLAMRCQALIPKEVGKPNPRLPAMALRAKQIVRNLNATNPHAYSDFQNDGAAGRGVTSGNLTLIGELG